MEAVKPSPGEPQGGAATLEGAAAQAVRLYEERLGTLLEKDLLGWVVAIHPDSADFAVGKNSPAARRALRERRREGMIVTMRIGPERPEPALDRAVAGLG